MSLFKFSTIISLILSSILGFSQENSNFIEVNTNPYFISGTYRAIGSVSVGRQFEKHSLSVGPTFLYASDIVTSNKNFPKLTGAQLNYKYFPNGISNKWDLYMFSQIVYQDIKDKWTSVIYNEDISAYQEFRYLNREYLVTANVGYGIKLKLSERLILSQGIGVGLYLSILDGDELSSDAPEIGENFGAGYAPIGITLSGNFGICYQFFSK